MACRVEGSPAAVTEVQGKRPADVEAREALRRRSEYQYDYGSNKLACEEALQKAFHQGGFPFTALRLADVAGPFDNIAAHLRYQLLLTLGKPVPCGLSSPRRHAAGSAADEERRLSLAFAPDVVTAIMAVLAAGPSGKAYNIASRETPTLREYVGTIARGINHFNKLSDNEEKEVNIAHVQFDNSRPSILPTVDFGPIDITRALEELEWEPTPFSVWVIDMVEWYNDPKNIMYHRQFRRE